MTRSEDPPPPPGSRPRRRRRVVIALVLVVGLGALGRNEVVGPPLLAWAAHRLETLGWELEVGDVAGSWLLGAELRELSLRSLDPDAPSQAWRAQRIAVTVSIVDLARGRLSGLRTVTVDAPRGELDLSADAAELEDESSPPLELPELLPVLDVNDGELRLRLSPERVVALTAIALTGAPGADAFTVELGADVDGLLSDPVRLDGRLDYTSERIVARRWTLRPVVRGDKPPLVLEEAQLLLAGLADGRLSWRAELGLDEGRLELEGDADEQRVRSDVRVRRFPVHAAAALALSGEPWPEGSFEGRLDVSWPLAGATPDATGRLEAEGVLTLAAGTTGRIDAEIRAPPGAPDDATVALSAVLDAPDLGGLLRTLTTGPDVDGALHGVLSVDGSLTNPRARFDAIAGPLTVDGLDFDEVSVQLAFVDDVVEVETIEVGLDSWRILARGTVATAAGVRVGVDAATIDGDALRVELSRPATIVLDDEQLAVDTLVLRDVERDASLTIAGRVDWPPDAPGGELDLTAVVAGPSLRLPDLAGHDLSGRLAADLSLAGTWEVPQARLSVSGDDVVIEPQRPDRPPDDGEAPPRLGPAGLRLVARLDGPRLTLDELSLSSPDQVELSASGASDLPALAALDRRSLEAAPVELRTTVVAPALSSIASFLPGVRWAAGALETEAKVTGSVGAPELEGRLTWTSGELRLPSSFPTLRDLTAEARFDRTTIVVERLAGTLGGAPFDGTVMVDARTDPPTVDAALRGDGLLLHRADGVRVRADADLLAHGPLDALTVDGELALVGTRVVKRLDLLGAIGDSGPPSSSGWGPLFRLESPPWAAAARLDVRITSVEPIAIRNNLVRGGARADLTLGGTGREPRLRGALFVEPTRVNLPGGPLYIERGLVRYTEQDPYVPLLELDGEARLRGYDVQIVVTGRADEPQVVLSSVPPLPQDELLALVVLGQVPKQSTRSGASAIGTYLAMDALSAWFDDESTEAGESVADRLEILIGADVTETGGETTEVRFRLTDDANQRSRVVYLTSERDVRDDVNLGLRWVFRFE